jgi:hypothetical protein
MLSIIVLGFESASFFPAHKPRPWGLNQAYEYMQTWFKGEVLNRTILYKIQF